MAEDKENHPNKAHREIGQDTVVIRDDKIVKRYNSLYKAMMAVEPDGDDTDFLTDEEERHFYELIGRDPSRVRYRIKKAFASGGMGVLYHVYDLDFQRNTAMKVILPELKSDDELMKAFIKEARITGQLEHPNIVPVHDIGYLPDDGMFFTMKYTIDKFTRTRDIVFY